MFSLGIWSQFPWFGIYNEYLYTKLRSYGFITVLYIHLKSLGINLRYFIFLKLCKCSWILHSLSRKHQLPTEQKPTTIALSSASTPHNTKLYHPVSRRSEKKLSTSRFTLQNPEISPNISFFNQHQKYENTIFWIYPVVTPEKTDELIYYVDRAKT